MVGVEATKTRLPVVAPKTSRSKPGPTHSWKLKVQPLEHGLNRTVIDDLKTSKTIHEKSQDYLTWVQAKVDRYKPAVFAAERYMVRGGGGTITIEYVAFMLGSVSSLLSPTPIKLLGASTWKNAFRRNTKTPDLDSVYAEVKILLKEGTPITPHQVDAFLLGVYVAHQAVGLKGYEYLPKNFLHLLCKTAPKTLAEVKPIKPPKRKTKRKRKK